MRNGAASGRLARAGLVLCGTGFIALGGLWLHDRTRVWEVPRWDEARFVAIGLRDSAWRAPSELWVVVVNPDCGHCGESLRNAGNVRERMTVRPRLAALVVDRSQRPPAVLFRAQALDAVWWDEREVWRTRWGHRVYGEVLRFDAAGRYAGSLSPEAVASAVPDR